jgi:hypothetical protein
MDHQITHYIDRVETTLNGVLDSANDEPALIYVDCRDILMVWYKNGLIHRSNDKPAMLYQDGGQRWYHNGYKHRKRDKPAVITADGTKKWYIMGKKHRGNDRPAVIGDDISLWYCNDKLHRIDDRPAVIAPGIKKYFKHDEEYIPTTLYHDVEYGEKTLVLQQRCSFADNKIKIRYILIIEDGEHAGQYVFTAPDNMTLYEINAINKFTLSIESRYGDAHTEYCLIVRTGCKLLTFNCTSNVFM